MIVIIGASASGKTEISKILQKKYNYKKLVTTTTRPIRHNETNHVDYHFITKDEFEDGLKNNDFFEHALYNNNYYGIHKDDIDSNKLVIVEPNGANELLRKLPNDVFIVYVKTRQRIRKQRMLDRLDDELLVYQRLKNDKKVFKRKNINRIDLTLKNNKTCINELAIKLHEKYLEFKK